MLKEWHIKGFDWDAGNSEKILRKHGLGMAVVEAFFHSEPEVIDDPRHSAQERRYLAIGLGPQGHPMLVSFTIRRKAHMRFLRPISARYMHASEARRHGMDKEPTSER